MLAGAGNATISSNLTLSGNNIFNVDTGRILTLNTGTFNRSTNRATLNIQIQGTGIASSAMMGLSTNVSSIIGPWASFGTGAATTYAKFSDSPTTTIIGLGYTGAGDGSAVTSAPLVVSPSGTINYTLNAVGTLGTSADVNTLRYSGGTGALVSSGTGFTTKGFMNVGGGTVDMQGTWTSGNASTEMVINAANGGIRLTGTSSLTGAITKTGSGTFTLGANSSLTGSITVNQGIFLTGGLVADALVGATINSGGTLQWGANNKHQDTAVFIINAGGTLNIGTLNDTIGGLSGAGTVTGTSGYIQLSEGNTFSGNITGAIGIRTSATTSDQILSGASDYSGGTIINAGFLQLNNSTAAGSNTIQLGNTTGSDTAELRLAATGTNVANALTVNAGSSGIKSLRNNSNNTVTYSGNITANDDLSIPSSYSSGRLTVSGAANTIASTKTVAFSNTGISLNSVTDSAIWGGDGKISYTADNNLGFIISGAKTYTGGATLGAMSGTGVVIVQTSSTGLANAPTNGAFGTGTLSIGATKMQAGTAGAVDITIGNAVTFTANPTFTTVVNERSLIFSGNATLGASRTLTVETGSTVAGRAVEFSGEISGAGFGITKEGAGRLVLSGNSTYDGATLVSAGTLFVTGELTSDVTVSNTATVGGGGTVDDISFGGGSFFDIALALASNPLDSVGISFAAAGFGIDNLVSGGLGVVWASVATGEYTLINGVLDETNLGNFGAGNAYDIGGGRSAYFTEGSLKLVVIPEPNVAALIGAFGGILLLRRRR